MVTCTEISVDRMNDIFNKTFSLSSCKIPHLEGLSFLSPLKSLQPYTTISARSFKCKMKHNTQSDICLTQKYIKPLGVIMNNNTV